MQKVTVTVDGVEKELINLIYEINSNKNVITINGQSYFMVDMNSHLCLDYNSNKIFKGDSVFTVDKVTFDKWQVIIYHSILNKLFHYFKTEEAADEFILKNSNHLCLDYNGNKIFKGDKIIAVGKVIFNKYVIVRASTVHEHYQYFTTEEAADKYIEDNKTTHIGRDYNGNKIFKKDYIFVVNRVNFYKYVIEIDHIGNEDNRYFTTEAAADNFIKANKPFTITTQDGFELKEGEQIIVVLYGTFTKLYTLVNKQDVLAGYPVFSADTAADNYIRENKACLSLKMVSDELEGKGYIREGEGFNMLCALVDSIIKSEGK